MGCNESVSVPSPPTVPERRPKHEPKNVTVSMDALPELANALESCAKIKDYSGVLAFLKDTTEADEVNSFPMWAATPCTTAAVAVRTLNRRLHYDICPLKDEGLFNHFDLIVEGITSQSPSLRHHLVYFLFKLSTTRGPEFNLKLVDKGIFSVLKLCLADRRYHFKVCVNRLCHALYRDNPRAKALFYGKIGVGPLVGQVQSGLASGSNISKPIEYLITLLKSEDNSIEPEYAKAVGIALSRCTIRKAALSFFTSDDVAALNELIDLLNQSGEVTFSLPTH